MNERMDGYRHVRTQVFCSAYNKLSSLTAKSAKTNAGAKSDVFLCGLGKLLMHLRAILTRRIHI